MNTRMLKILFLISLSMFALSQDKLQIERAVLDYIEGFYSGDTLKISRSLHPNLSKFGFGYDKENKRYKIHSMTYKGAINFAKDVNENSDYAAPKNAVQEIEILDAQEMIANVKVTVYWGIDYLLLAKFDGTWKVTKVLWQSKE